MTDVNRTIARVTALLALLVLLPALALADSFAVVRGGQLNLRAQASASSQSLGRYGTGTWVRVNSYAIGGWYAVTTMTGKSGYMDGRYLSFPASTNDYTVRYANGGYVNLRSGPSMDASIIMRVTSGSTASVQGQYGDWCLVGISTQNGVVSGYMLASFLESATPTSVVTTRNGGKVNLRSGPSSSYGSVGSLASGTRVSVLLKGNDWYYITGGGLTGFMSTSYLSGTGATVGSNTGSGGTVTSQTAYVNNPRATQVLNLREYPSQAARSIGQYRNGTQVKVVSYGASWCEVYVGTKHGYMATNYLSFSYVPPASGGTGSTGGSTGGSNLVAYVTNPRSTQVLNLREYPSQDARSLGQYRNGTRVNVVTYGANWCEVYVGDKHGYMMTSYLNFNYAPLAAGSSAADGSISALPTATPVPMITAFPTATPVPMITATPTATPVPPASVNPGEQTYPQTTPAAGAPVTLVESTGGLISVYNDQTMTQLKATVPDRTAAVMLSYGETFCMVLLDGGVVYVSTQYVSY